MKIIEYGYFAEFEKREREVFPHNKIILWDGRMLDCYPLAAQAPDKIDEDHLQSDKDINPLSYALTKKFLNKEGVLQVIELLNKEGISLYIQNYNIETLTEEGKINPCPHFSMKYDYRRNRVLDDKEYNRKIYEKMLAKNPALNELVVGLGLMPENE